MKPIFVVVVAYVFSLGISLYSHYRDIQVYEQKLYQRELYVYIYSQEAYFKGCTLQTLKVPKCRFLSEEYLNTVILDFKDKL